MQPVEIAARLQRELDTEAKLMSRDKRLVPNEFIVGLSQHDHDKLAPYAKTLNTELAGELRNHAREMGYVFNGPIDIEFELETQLPTGRFTVARRRSPGSRTRALPAAQPPGPPRRSRARSRPSPRPAPRAPAPYAAGRHRRPPRPAGAWR